MSCRNLALIDTKLPVRQALRIPLEPLWLNGWDVHREPDHHFYVSANREVLVMEWTGIWV